MTDKEREIMAVKRLLQLENYGIKIENVKQETGMFGFPENFKIYFSVPESSTMYDEDENESYNEKLKTSEGLTQIAKELIADIIMCFDDDGFISPDDIEKMKANKFDFVKFYVKVRKGEVWSREKGEEKLKAANERLQIAVDKLKAEKDFEEA